MRSSGHRGEHRGADGQVAIESSRGRNSRVVGRRMHVKHLISTVSGKVDDFLGNTRIRVDLGERELVLVPPACVRDPLWRHFQRLFRRCFDDAAARARSTF